MQTPLHQYEDRPDADNDARKRRLMQLKEAIAAGEYDDSGILLEFINNLQSMLAADEPSDSRDPPDH